MNTKANPKIDNFIQDILFIDEKKSDLLICLRKMVLEIKPEAKEEIKYGGLVFIVDTKLICGIFIRKNHISVEFSFGAMMLDPNNCLEGSGKYRRHLKIVDKKDIENKNVEYYVKQSFIKTI